MEKRYPTLFYLSVYTITGLLFLYFMCRLFFDFDGFFYPESAGLRVALLISGLVFFSLTVFTAVYSFRQLRKHTEERNVEHQALLRKLKESKEKIEKLHQVALQLTRSETEDEVFQIIINAAEQILHFQVCSVVMIEGEYFVLKSRSARMAVESRPKLPLNQGLCALTHQTLQTQLVNDLAKDTVAKPLSKEFRSIISTPIGDMGVFQVVSTKVNDFDKEDVELTELLISHASEALRRIRFEEKIKFLSFHDSVTSLYNRAYFDIEIQRLDSPNYLPLSLVMGDINDLKLVNDVFGHIKGDELIALIGDVLRQVCRSEDVIVRWGGDEFVILLPNTEERTALEICSKIRAICNFTTLDLIRPSIALGVAVKTDNETSIYEVLKEAENRMYRNKLAESKSARSSIITSLEKTLWEKSFETREHANRMQKMALRVGKFLDLTDSQLDNLSLLATLHDIGKIAIPEEIIKKPGPLNLEEWDNIKRHPEIGYRIAASIPELGPIAEGILSHHERFDGTGYPQGLTKTDIPLIARIVSLVDAYDVMTNGRPYKKALNNEEALAELKKCAGSQFDPELVELFTKVMSEN